MLKSLHLLGDVHHLNMKSIRHRMDLASILYPFTELGCSQFRLHTLKAPLFAHGILRIPSYALAIFRIQVFELSRQHPMCSLHYFMNILLRIFKDSCYCSVINVHFRIVYLLKTICFVVSYLSVTTHLYYHNHFHLSTSFFVFLKICFFMIIRYSYATFDILPKQYLFVKNFFILMLLFCRLTLVRISNFCYNITPIYKMQVFF